MRIAGRNGSVIASDLCKHYADEQIRGNARKYAYGLLIELADEAAGLAALTEPVSRLPHADREKWMAPIFRPLGARMLAPGAVRAAAS